MYKIGDTVKTEFGIGVVKCKYENLNNHFIINIRDVEIIVHVNEMEHYKTAHEKLIELGLRLKITKNYADGVFSHEWWNKNDDRIIVFYIDEKVTTVYEGSNEIMAIIPQYLEELEK